MRLFAAGLLVFLALSARGWNGSLLDFHGFRQTQTAITVRGLLQGGPWLAYETPVLGAPWSIPFELPVYQWLVAAAARMGIPLDQAGRLVSVLFFLSALLPLHAVLRAVRLQRRERAIVLALVCLSPEYIVWSRAFMIESTALALAIGFLWLATRALARVREAAAPGAASVSLRLAGPLAAVAAAGSLAAAVKVTTFVPFLAAAWALAAAQYLAERTARASGRAAAARPYLLLAAATLLPVLAGVGWTAFADATKRLNPIGANLTSAGLSEWNFAYAGQRTSLQTWAVLYDRAGDVIGAGWLLALAAVLAWGCEPARRRLAAAALGLWLLPIAAFTNLHFVHSYYGYANGVFLIAAVGIIGADLLHAQQRTRRALGSLLLAAVAAACLSRYHERYWPLQGQVRRLEALTADVNRRTGPDDVLVILGADWAPEIPYYAGRRALMLPSWVRSAPVYEQARRNLSAYHVGAVLFCNGVGDNEPVVQRVLRDFDVGPDSGVPYPECDVYYASRAGRRG